ncbi:MULTISPECIES: prepilin peptidase [unclassified Frondihabitans]|uniref:prepilin peptidase n=1 Tax=unclassified Frondihabitans TaxID=2626248 RepID=UPI000F513727|nr:MULTISPECIES: prepilin peptidase [unclassified Frondihabitans]RPE76255.1 type IV leader peptidase family protein [Frondihabitans sp. PhB153]RPF05469.1 type IV leader peptidase family protein [Frondihabitans sp. PhB161]
MIAFVDAAVVLALLGVAAPSPPGALVPAVWLAFTTPLLIRSDVTRRRLPNLATMPALGLVLGSSAVAVFVDTGVKDPALALLVTTLIAAGGLLSVRLGGVGLGDVKLAAAAAGSAALVGADAAWALMVVAGAAGGAVVLAVRLRLGLRRVARRKSRCVGPAREVGEIPYGPCLLFGYWVALAAVNVV